MRWTPGGTSGNIEDRRSGGGFGGGGMKLGLGGLVIAGQDFFSILGGGGSGPERSPQQDQARNRQEQPMVEFVSFVLDDTQSTWRKIFSSMGKEYRDAKLVLFRDGVASACGNASSA